MHRPILTKPFARGGALPVVFVIAALALSLSESVAAEGFPRISGARIAGVAGVPTFNPEGQVAADAHLAGAVGMAVVSFQLPDGGGQEEGEEEEGGEQQGGGDAPQSAGPILSHPACSAFSRVPPGGAPPGGEVSRTLGFTTSPSTMMLAITTLGSDRIIGVTAVGTVVTTTLNSFVRDPGLPSGPSGQGDGDPEGPGDDPEGPGGEGPQRRRFRAQGAAAHRPSQSPNSSTARTMRAQQGLEELIDCRMTNEAITSVSLNSFGSAGSGETWSFQFGNSATAHTSSNPGHITAVTSAVSDELLVFIADTGSHVLSQVRLGGEVPTPIWIQQLYGLVDVPGITATETMPPTGRLASPKAIVAGNTWAFDEAEEDDVQQLSLFVGMANDTLCGVVEFIVVEGGSISLPTVKIVTMLPCMTVPRDPWRLAGNPTGLTHDEISETLYIADGASSRILAYSLLYLSWATVFAPVEETSRHFHASMGGLQLRGFGPLGIMRDSSSAGLLALHEGESTVHLFHPLPNDVWDGTQPPTPTTAAPVTTGAATTTTGAAPPSNTTAVPTTTPPNTTGATTTTTAAGTATAPPSTASGPATTAVPAPNTTLAPNSTGAAPTTPPAPHPPVRTTRSRSKSVARRRRTATWSLVPAPSLTPSHQPTSTATTSHPQTNSRSVSSSGQSTVTSTLTLSPSLVPPPTPTRTALATLSASRSGATASLSAATVTVSSSARSASVSRMTATVTAALTRSHETTATARATQSPKVTRSASVAITDSDAVTNTAGVTRSDTELPTVTSTVSIVPPPPPTQPDVDPNAALGAAAAGTAVAAGAAALTGSSPVGDAQALVIVGLMGCAAESTQKSMAPSSPLVAPLQIGSGEYSSLAGCVTLIVAFGVFHAIGADLTVNISRRKARAKERKRIAARLRKERRQRKRLGVKDPSTSPERADGSDDDEDSADERARIRKEANEEIKAAERAELDDSDNEELAEMNRKAHAKSKFPAVTLSVFNFLLPGTSFFAMREVLNPATRTAVGTTLGAMAVVLILGVVAATAYAVQADNFDGIYCRYTNAFKKAKPVARNWLLPRGFWIKNTFTHRFGPAFKSAKRRRCIYFFSVVTPIKTLLFSLFAAMNPKVLFGPGTCWLQWCFIAVVCIVYAGIVIKMRPFRMPIGNVLTVLGQLAMLVLCASQLTPLMQQEMAKAAVICALTVAVLSGIAGVGGPLMERFVWQKKEQKARKKQKPVFGQKRWSPDDADDEEIDEFGDSDEEERRKDAAAAKRVAKRKKEVVDADAQRTTQRALRKEQRRRQREASRRGADSSDETSADSSDSDEAETKKSSRRRAHGTASPPLTLPQRPTTGGAAATSDNTTMMALLGGEEATRPYNPFFEGQPANPLASGSRRNRQMPPSSSSEAEDPSSSARDPDDAVASGMLLFGALPPSTAPPKRNRNRIEL